MEASDALVDVDELPLDEPPEQEGDDSVAHAATGGAVDEAQALAEEESEQEAMDPDDLVVDEDDEEGIGLSIKRLRVRVVRAAMLGYQHRERVHYTQTSRRWEGIASRCRSHLGRYPQYADCSSYVTWCIWDALGGPNAGPDVVNGQQWTQGYTGTLKQHGRRVSLANAVAGDLVHYGPGTGSHVAIIVAANKVISHGSEGSPSLVRPDYRSDISEVRRYFG